MSRFDDLLSLVWHNEGVTAQNTGLADIPGDPGGVTNYGISQRAWNKLHYKLPYAGFPVDVRLFSLDEARTIYKNEYYLPIHADELPFGVAYVLFDAAVNQGVVTAIQLLQRAVGVTDDGIWGPKTALAVRSASTNVPKLIESLLWQRLAEYAKDSRHAGESSRFPWFTVSLWIPRLLAVRTTALSRE